MASAALGTLGTVASTTLPAMVWGLPASIANADFPKNYVQDIALLNAYMTAPDNSIINSSGTVVNYNRKNFTGANQEACMLSGGMLYIPSRGSLKLFNGDVIAVDPTTGWPIIINAYTAAQAANWTVANNS